MEITNCVLNVTETAVHSLHYAHSSHFHLSTTKITFVISNTCVSCFSKIQIGFTFLVPAYLGSHGKNAVKRV